MWPVGREDNKGSRLKLITNRRTFIAGSLGLGASTLGIPRPSGPCRFLPSLGQPCQAVRSVSIQQPAFAIIPVVYDGKWNWKNPPEGSTGYLEPRDFEVSVGMSFTGRGFGNNLRATTVTPVGFPEQEILDFQIETQGCSAKILPINAGAAQLALSAGSLAAGQTVFAIARYKLRVTKVFQGFQKEQFPTGQEQLEIFSSRYLRNSPGIKANSKLVSELVTKITSANMHPWDKAVKFQQWVWENIQGVAGRYTSVEEAIREQTGDCEERACVFIALCRAAGIPARQVWVPSHVWAEIGLHDREGRPCWIPVHTAAYNWFGWTGAHEIVLQKGDYIRIGHRKRTVRLIDDWYQLNGPKPDMYYSAQVKPVAPAGYDAGPGARSKLPDGRWELAGNHPDNKHMRDK